MAFSRRLRRPFVGLAAAAVCLQTAATPARATEDSAETSARTGVVRVDGRAFRDDAGVFNSFGASLFWLAWGVKFDRARVEANLKTLADAGVDYVRAFGVVGPGGGWADREVDPRWPDHAKVIADATDLAYDRFGLRVQWTIFGGIDRVGTPEARAGVVDRFVEIARGREHKVMLFEIANEGWQNGFGGEAGRAEIRALGRRLSDATSVPVALTAPEGGLAGLCPLYGGAGVDVITWHHDRSRAGAAGPWRPVIEPLRARRALDAKLRSPGNVCGALPTAIVNNEPIGPGSSLEEERDPLRIAMVYVLTFAARHAAFVLHTGPGIRGGGQVDRERGRQANVGDLPEFAAIAHALAGARRVMPAGLANWTPIDPADRGAPLQGLAEAIARGDLVEAALARQGDEIFGALVGVRRPITVRAAAPLTMDLLDPGSGDVVQHLELVAGRDSSIGPRPRDPQGDALLVRLRLKP